jgi:hypothetical protein
MNQSLLRTDEAEPVPCTMFPNRRGAVPYGQAGNADDGRSEGPAAGGTVEPGISKVDIPPSDATSHDPEATGR